MPGRLGSHAACLASAARSKSALLAASSLKSCPAEKSKLLPPGDAVVDPNLAVTDISAGTLLVYVKWHGRTSPMAYSFVVSFQSNVLSNCPPYRTIGQPLFPLIAAGRAVISGFMPADRSRYNGATQLAFQSLTVPTTLSAGITSRCTATRTS